MKKSIWIRLDEPLYDLVQELAREQLRTIPNFIDQFLNVSLSENMDRSSLAEKMNPAMTSMLRKERERLAERMKA